MLPQLEVLFEAPRDSPAVPLPDDLAAAYGGPLVLGADCCYANVVSSLDGVVSAPGVLPSQLAQASPADRFGMALLRSAADAVLIGAGTLRAEPGHRWTPAAVWPEDPAAGAFAGHPDPRLVVVTASGDLGGHAALDTRSIVVTTPAGAAALGTTPARVVALGDAPLDPGDVLAVLRAEGLRRILTEAGPGLLGSLLGAGLVDELFLTVSPVLVGGLAGAQGLAGRAPLWSDQSDQLRTASLLSARRHHQHLFLRYRLPLGFGPAGRPSR